MTTAVAEMEPQANGTVVNGSKPTRKPAAPAFPLDTNSPLGFPCPVLGLTGPKWSGKTIFSLSIAPGVHPAGHPFAGHPRTLSIDFETSTTGYSTGADKWNAPELLRQRYGGKQLSALDIFVWFRDAILAIEPNRYDVIAADPVTDAEDGLVDYVRKHPTEFGYTANQFANSTALLMGATKNYWKRILVDFTARCKVFAFVAHDRMEFVGGRPTGKKIPKGKETLFELASLYLEFSREQVGDGERPKPPSAKVLKSRFAHTHISPETGELEIVEILPQRIPIATPAEIRKYVQSPVGLRKVKAAEIAIEKEPTEFERQMLTLEIETQRAAAENAKLAAAERMASAAAAVQQTAMPQFHVPTFQAATTGPAAVATTVSNAAPVATVPTSEPIGETLEQPADQLPNDAAAVDSGCPFNDGSEGAHYDNTNVVYGASRCTEIQVQQIRHLFAQMGEASGGKFGPENAAAIIRNRGCNTIAELTMDAADQLTNNLQLELQKLFFTQSLEANTARYQSAGEDACQKN